MSQSSFRYETSQKLPATLTAEEHNALRMAVQGLRAAVLKILRRITLAPVERAGARGN